MSTEPLLRFIEHPKITNRPGIVSGREQLGGLSNFSRQVITHTRRSSRFGRQETASRLRERTRWSIAPTDEFVGVWILGVWIPTSLCVSGFTKHSAIGRGVPVPL